MMYYIRNPKGEYLTKIRCDRFMFQKDVSKAMRFSTKEDAVSFCKRNKYESVDGKTALQESDYEIKGLGVDKA